MATAGEATERDATVGPGQPEPAPWAAPLAAELEALAPERRRRLRNLSPCGSAGLRPVDGAGGPPLLDLASNDYLGLAHDPSLQQAASAAMARDGR